MATSTMTELIAETRRLVAFPAPPTGGADKLNDTDILKWLNNWFGEMADLVSGIHVYLDITIDSAGTIAVVNSNSTPVVTTADMVKTDEDYTYISWPNIRNVGRPINRTTGLSTNYRAMLVRMNRNDPMYQYKFRESGEYYEYYDYVPGKGLVFMPMTITQTNTIRIPYAQEYIRLVTGGVPTSFFSEADTMAAVNHAAYYCAVVLGLDQPDRFLRDRDDVTARFVGSKYTQDTGSAYGFDNSILSR